MKINLNSISNKFSTNHTAFIISWKNIKLANGNAFRNLFEAIIDVIYEETNITIVYTFITRILLFLL